jgi:hypothetical protein
VTWRRAVGTGVSPLLPDRYRSNRYAPRSTP